MPRRWGAIGLAEGRPEHNRRGSQSQGAAAGPAPDAPHAGKLSDNWRLELVGYGKKEVRGTKIADYTWGGLIGGATVGGGRYAWLENMLGWHNDQVAAHDNERWHIGKRLYVEAALAAIRSAGSPGPEQEALNDLGWSDKDGQPPEDAL